MSATKNTGGIRLLMVNTVKSELNGQTLIVLKYLRAMDRAGMTIGYASKGEPAPEIRQALEALGVKVWALPERRGQRPLSYGRALSRIVRREGYNIVHVHGNSATVALDLLASRLGGARVRIAHSHNTTTGYPLVNRLLKPLMFLNANGRMACGREAGQWMFGNRPFDVIPIASDADEYAFDAARREQKRREMGVGPEDILLMLVGLLTPQKNHAFLLDAFADAVARNPRLKLMLVGGGELRQPLEEQVARLHLGDSVTFTGPVRDVPDRMRAADALVLPSLYEGFPNVLVEAQLSGLPALVSDKVTRDCDMTGLLAWLPLDRAAWAEAMAAHRPIDRDAASRAAREAIALRGFDIRAAAAKLRGHYEQLLESGR